VEEWRSSALTAVCLLQALSSFVSGPAVATSAINKLEFCCACCLGYQDLDHQEKIEA